MPGAASRLFRIFRRLSLYPDDVLDARYDLFKTGDPAHFARLQALATT